MTRRDAIAMSLLGMVGGWIDASSYLQFDTFAGAMTGNSVLLGIAAIRGASADALYHLAIILAFLAGIVAAETGIRAHLSRRRLLLIAATSILSTLCMHGPWLVLALALAMGIQNAAVAQMDGMSVNTAFVSGNLARLGRALGNAADSARKRTLLILANVWLSYVLGAALGALATGNRSPIIAIPAAMLILASVLISARPKPGDIP